MTHRALLTVLALVIVALFAADPLADVAHGASPAGGPGTPDVWGNLDCMNGVTAADGIVILANMAGVDAHQDPNCPPIGGPVSYNGGGSIPFGDINCSGQPDINDTLALLNNLSGASSSIAGCFPIGIDVQRQALGEAFTTEDSWRDYGDAPDGGPTGYSSGATTSHFPTLPANGGPSHAEPLTVALGESVTVEDVPNADDAGDDGLLYSDLHGCAASSLLVLINTASLTAQQRAQPLYLNVFADWNQDGDWLDSDRCAPEAAALNQPLDLAESGTFDTFSVDFTAGELPPEFWLRITLTPQPYTLGTQGLPGETEDYLIDSSSPLPSAATPQGIALPQYDKDKAGKEFVCKGGWVVHGGHDMTIDIEQTQDSKTGGFRPKNPRLGIGPVKDLDNQNPKGINITNTKLDPSTLNDGRERYRLTLTVASKEDAPNRVEGPFYVEIKITGTDQKKAQFKGTIICGFYIDHSGGAKPYNPDNDGFQGGPGHGGTGPGLTPQPFYVIEHGKKPTVFSDSPRPTDEKNTSKTDPKSITVFGPDGAQLDKADWGAKAGIKDIKTGEKGRGLIITTIEDKRDDPVQPIVIRVTGTLPDGTTKFTDFYRVIIVHEKGAKVKKLVEDLNLFYVANPVYPEDYAFAVNYVDDGQSFVEQVLDPGGNLTFDPATICTVSAGDQLLSPVAGERAFVIKYPSGASDLFELTLAEVPPGTVCEAGANLTGYGANSLFAVEHPTWCWNDQYGFTEFDLSAITDRLAFLGENGPFPLANGDGLSDSTCFRSQGFVPFGQGSGFEVGMTARKADGSGSDVWYVPFDCGQFCPQGGSLPASAQRIIDITGDNMHALGAVVSPDGTKIAWALAELNAAGDTFVSGQVWVADFDAATLTVSNETALTTDSLNLHPQWSPDSSQIVFDSNRGGNSEVYIMDADGGNQTNMTNTPNINETQPSWQTP